jgi:hypothetical protein
MRLIDRQRCSESASLNGRPGNILIIGAERWDEFADALKLENRYRRVIVTNPRETHAAKRFVNEGGTFFKRPVERLPARIGPFQLVCENYPYTVGPVEGICDQSRCPMWLSRRVVRSYAIARLKRLAPDGRWVLFTESPGLAKALRSIGRTDEMIRRHFDLRIVRVANQRAPPSSYPYLTTRFKIVFEKRARRTRIRRLFANT